MENNALAWVLGLLGSKLNLDQLTEWSKTSHFLSLALNDKTRDETTYSKVLRRYNSLSPMKGIQNQEQRYWGESDGGRENVFNSALEFYKG